MAPDLCLIAKTIEWLNSTRMMTVKIKPKVSLSALVSMESMPDTKSPNKVIVPRINEYTITTDIINTIIPKIVRSNHSYIVRPLACLRNTSSRNTGPPFGQIRLSEFCSEQAVCHAMVQHRILMEIENDKSLYEAARGAGTGLFTGRHQRRRKGRMAGWTGG